MSLDALGLSKGVMPVCVEIDIIIRPNRSFLLQQATKPNTRCCLHRQ